MLIRREQFEQFYNLNCRMILVGMVLDYYLVVFEGLRQSTNTLKVSISFGFNTEPCETSLKELDVGGMKKFLDSGLGISDLGSII